MASENSRLSSRIAAKTMPGDVRTGALERPLDGRADRRTGRAGHRRLLVPLPRAADEDVADHVEAEGDQEQDEARGRTGSGTPRCRRSTWSDPVASAAIAAVSVCPGPSGSMVNSEPPVAPAATATTIVSPIAREIARIIAATMPETAAGTTTRRLVVRRRAPRP